mmetsp:Transcript_8364/g.10618  ORF Transcript_8364/g.10618 Transcript_8364/m.10618 type:complete len:214 (-) Transcript_8364:713-1354(-)
MEPIIAKTMKIKIKSGLAMFSHWSNCLGHPTIAEKRSHGSGRPTATSKMFEPIEDDTAMSPWPCWATMMLESRSGIDVPAARNVRPAINVGIFTVPQMPSTKKTRAYDIHMMWTIAIKNVVHFHFSLPGTRQSGTVTARIKVIGKVKMMLSLVLIDISLFESSSVCDTMFAHMPWHASLAPSAASVACLKNIEFVYHFSNSSKESPPSPASCQ